MPGTGGRTTLTLRVQTGCDEQCSYCIIPKTRGSSRSHPMARVLSDIERALAAGYKEIVLTGVHLGSYGRDLAERASLVDLVGVLAGFREDVLFRISSLEPMDCAPQLLDLVASSPRLAPHFHLPLQHGCDEMLAAMRRPYTARYYKGLVERIRARLPHASIGTDLIVGFPGETEAQYDEMHRFVRDLPLTHLHVFPYSDRPGTEASRMDAKLEGAAIRARGRALRDLSEEKSRCFKRFNVGATSRALTIDDGWSAVTPNYLKVKLDRQCARNEWVNLHIESADPLAGRVTAPSVRSVRL
jgi:threonylcarbamoyladenosine tRNA methylthiotransferase MtaB